MAPIAYLTVHGQRQGDIKGGATEKRREGSIPLISVAYEVDAPVDPATGHVTGKRIHKPVTIIKVIDQASPKLLEALVTNEVLTSVKIEFWRPAPEAAAPYFIIALTNALVTNAALSSSSGSHAQAPDAHELEEIEFTYQKITWTYPENGDEAQDDWASQS
ncbi:MAG: type VI secretion system tube protein Hcp [Hyphomicrobiales bacterium]|nr:type VI secretion system tube protein Hcp [Hyphomicrobiales bacterium]MBV8441656.1 type VI secretion system tube protein Hcp [Hyphomicrobiales bacterium]